MAVIKSGPRKWEGSRDAEGQRSFTVTYRIYNDAITGPAAMMDPAGLPSVGSAWNVESDYDGWAFRTLQTKATPVVKDGDRKGTGQIWDVTLTFSTKQPERCQDQQVEDPLSEPQKVSGSFVNYTKEAIEDKDGNKIENSSHEQIRGSAVEFDNHRPTVQIGQNVANLQLETFSPMVNTVNDAALWGLAARKVKLSNVSWSRELYGLCYFYYTRKFEFDIDFNTFDRDIVDEGTMVLLGDWAFNADGSWSWVPRAGAAANVKDFMRFKDPNGENRRVLLDGAGNPLGDGAAVVNIPNSPIQYYAESNFLTLNIPSTL